MAKSALTGAVIKYEVNVIRDWAPVYFLTGKRAANCPEPASVQISVELDTAAAAEELQSKVLKLLEEAMTSD